MYAGKRILAVVPARGGSKGIPLKNMYPLNGKPLIRYTGECLDGIDEIDRSVVSTDHDGIAEAAVACGIEAPFMRPEDLGGDRVSDLEVLSHALRAMDALDNCTYDVVVMLQPTCPLRTKIHVASTMHKLIDEGCDAVWTVSKTDSKAHPLKQLVIKDGLLGYYDPRGEAVVARQQLDQLYHRNGAAYAITRSCLLEQQSISGKKCGSVVVEESLANIDTIEDIHYAEFLLQRGSEKQNRDRN